MLIYIPIFQKNLETWIFMRNSLILNVGSTLKKILHVPNKTHLWVLMGQRVANLGALG